MSDGVDLGSRGSFSYWYDEKLRFSDTDMLGHVNNVAFAALIESGRVAFTREGLGVRLPRGTVVVMVRLEIDYRAELHYPATVEIGSRLLRLGRTSLVVGSSIFTGERCAATSVTTLVLIGTDTRRPVPIPDDARVILQSQLR